MCRGTLRAWARVMVFGVGVSVQVSMCHASTS